MTEPKHSKNLREIIKRPPKVLTARQSDFWKQFQATGNAAESYRRAYKCKHSAAYCTKEGQKLLKHPLISPLVEAVRDVMVPKPGEAVRHFELTKNRVLTELARMAYVNMADLAEELPDGGGIRWRRFNELSRHETAAIRKMTIENITRGEGDKAVTTQRIGIELYDKRMPLQLIGQEMGMFKPEPEPPPPPPPVGADQQPNAATTPDAKAAARQRMLRLLDSLARPEPMEIEAEPEPPRPNGKTNGTNGHGH